MNWTCEEIEARLSDYLDRLLEPGERSGFDAHVAGCARCAPLVGMVAGTVAGLHGLEPFEAPPRLHYRILDHTLGPRGRKKGMRAWLAWLRPLSSPRLIYGAASVAVTMAVLFQALGLEWRVPRLSDLAPSNVYRTTDRRVHLLYARGAKFVTDLRVVYEIQSRLRPEAEPQTTAPEQPSDEQRAPQKSPRKSDDQSSGPQPKSRRELDRAKDRTANLTTLACAVGGLPARSDR